MSTYRMGHSGSAGPSPTPTAILAERPDWHRRWSPRRAAAGGMIGNQNGRGLEGVAIGAGLGALAGNASGNSQDQRNSQYYNNGRCHDNRGRYQYRNGRRYYY